MSTDFGVESLSRPGGNITGVTGPPFEVHLKRLELLVEAVPSVSKVLVMGNRFVGLDFRSHSA